jgi:cyclase
MLRKRIIFALIYSDGFFNQSRNFRLQRVGDLEWLEKNYCFQDIAFSLDELIVLNASRKQKGMVEFAAMIRRLVDDVFVPLAAGGGIRCMEDAKALFDNGADKIVLNSALWEQVELVRELVGHYGTQSVVASVDYRRSSEKEVVFIRDGTQALELSLEDYLAHVEGLGVGEIYLNSMEKDGTGFGYDLATSGRAGGLVQIPLIIAGGAGNEDHLIEGLQLPGVNAVATANLFNFVGDGLPVARRKILESGQNIANWDANL